MPIVYKNIRFVLLTKTSYGAWIGFVRLYRDNTGKRGCSDASIEKIKWFTGADGLKFSCIVNLSNSFALTTLNEHLRSCHQSCCITVLSIWSIEDRWSSFSFAGKTFDVDHNIRKELLQAATSCYSLFCTLLRTRLRRNGFWIIKQYLKTSGGMDVRKWGPLVKKWLALFVLTGGKTNIWRNRN